MSWHRIDKLTHRSFTRRGLDASILAGRICHQAEALYPNLFRAISLRNETLHLEVAASQQLAFRMVEGKLLQELANYATTHQLPTVKRIRLTIIRN